MNNAKTVPVYIVSLVSWMPGQLHTIPDIGPLSFFPNHQIMLNDD